MRLLTLMSLAVCLFVTPLIALAADGDQITGIWQSEGGTYFQVYRSGKAYVAKIVGSRKHDIIRDKGNADDSQKNRNMIGKVVLHSLRYQGDGEYDQGRIYNPKNGKTYDAKASMKGPDTLEARGYIGISLLGKDETWKRVSPDARHVQQDKLHKPMTPQHNTASEKP